MISLRNTKVEFKDFTVGDVFYTVRGISKYTRGYGVKHRGEYPVYSASSVGPLTAINSFDHDGNFLSWATNGYGGSMKVLSGKFSINGDRALLIPKIDGVDLNYSRLILEPIFRQSAVGRRVDGKRNEYTKLPPSKVTDITFQLPVTANGKIDAKAQAVIVGRANKLETLRDGAKEIHDTIAACLPVPQLNPDASTTLQLVGSWVEFISTKTGWTKTEYSHFDTGMDKHFPVYSAAKSPVAFVKETVRGLINADEVNPIISFASNGEGSAGTNFVFHTSPFYVSNDRTCLRITAKDILPEYVFFALHGIKQTYGFGHTFKASMKNLECVTVSIPVKSNGKYDKQQQQKLVKQYNKLYEAKAILESQLESIISCRVTSPA